MQVFDVLYGSGSLELSLPSTVPCQILEPMKSARSADPVSIVKDALANPIGAADIRELTRIAQKVLIITNDNTRPMPSPVTLPLLIDSFCYSKEHYEITILIATGLHRMMTDDEVREQLGSEIFDAHRIVVHQATDSSSLASFGVLSSGRELFLNRLAAENDLVIAEGFIEPHLFAGFSGGRKSILPGIAGAQNILENHSPGNIANPASCQASLSGNPIHEECVEAARLAKLRFILNVALDDNKQIIASFAGDPELAHREGCRFVEERMTIDAYTTDIVITSNHGYPLDRNLYQAVKGIDTAAKVVRKEGVIIMAAELRDGVGHHHFRDLILSCESVEELYVKMFAPPCAVDKWMVQPLAKVMRDKTVILVSEGIEKTLAERLFFKHATSLDEALNMATLLTSKDATITVMPEGPVIIPRIASCFEPRTDSPRRALCLA